jgi:hypothetical protein
MRTGFSCLRSSALFALLAACGSDELVPSETPNLPPVWSDAVDQLTIGEGKTLRLPLSLSDPEGGAVTIEGLGASHGLFVGVDDHHLVIDVGYAPSAPSLLSLEFVDDVGNEVRHEIAIEVLPLRWLGRHSWTGDGPEEREHPSALVDRAGRQAFVFQGSGYHPQFEQMLGDVWRYDLDAGSWTDVVPTGDVAIGAGSRRFAGAFGASTGLLFGGYGPPPAAYDDLYRVTVEGSTLRFDVVPQANAPQARFLHVFAFDPLLERYFLFGGVSTTIFGDTWMMEIDGAGTAVWTKLDIPGPSPRYGAFYGFDEKNGRLIVFSGAQAPVAGNPVNAAGDTWALSTRSDPPTWTLLAEGAFAPPGRRNGSAAWDEPSSRLFVFGGTADAATTQEGLFVFDARPGLEGWHELPIPDAPPSRSSGLGFHDGERAFVGFGNSNAVYRDLATLGH